VGAHGAAMGKGGGYLSSPRGKEGVAGAKISTTKKGAAKKERGNRGGSSPPM